jgi:hypothetical protein
MRLYGGAQFHRCDCSGAPGHSLFLARHLLLSPALRGPAPSANLQIAWPASEAPSFDRSQTDLPAALHLFQLCSAMAEFRLAVGQLTCPDISREEIVNACGVDDVHDGGTRARRAARGARCRLPALPAAPARRRPFLPNTLGSRHMPSLHALLIIDTDIMPHLPSSCAPRPGVNYVRTACVIAVSKARDIFEPFMHQVCGGRPRQGRRSCSASCPSLLLTLQRVARWRRLGPTLCSPTNPPI